MRLFEHEAMKSEAQKRSIITYRVYAFGTEQFITRVLTRSDGFNEKLKNKNEMRDVSVLQLV